MFRPEPDYQFVLCVLVIACVLVVAADTYRHATLSARMTEAVWMARHAQNTFYLEHEEFGRWPTAGAREGDATLDHGFDKPLTLLGIRADRDLHVELRDRGEGAFAVVLTDEAFGELRGRELAYRPAFASAHGVSPTYWTCAGAPPPMGSTVRGVDTTDLPPAFLPHVCRGPIDAETE